MPTRDETARRARAHFRATLGSLPRAVEVMARYAPQALEGYLALREYAHREAPAGDLDAVTRELLFVSLDVAMGHVEAAKDHAAAALKAGASVEAIAQSCVITMMVAGIHTWSQHGHVVVEYAARSAERAQRAKRGPRSRPDLVAAPGRRGKAG